MLISVNKRFTYTNIHYDTQDEFGGWCELTYYRRSDVNILVATEPIDPNGHFINPPEASVIRSLAAIIFELKQLSMFVHYLFVILPARRQKPLRVMQILHDGSSVRIGSIEHLENFIGAPIEDWDYRH